jgi:hypothetical protein
MTYSDTPWYDDVLDLTKRIAAEMDLTETEFARLFTIGSRRIYGEQHFTEPYRDFSDIATDSGWLELEGDKFGIACEVTKTIWAGKEEV